MPGCDKALANGRYLCYSLRVDDLRKVPLEILEPYLGYGKHMELQIGSFRGALRFMRLQGIS